MMINRDRVNFWIRFVAIFLAVIFLGSFVFMGIGTNVNYNLLELIGGDQQQQQAEQQGGGVEEQIAQAEQNYEENPEDPQAIKTLGALYLQNNRTEDAVRVLEDGQEIAPEDEEMPILLGQVRAQQAQTASEDERQELYRQAGDDFARATEIDPENEDAYLLAGEAYDQAGEPGQAIRYWNEYLDREPEGEQADAIRERISQLLSGGEETDPAAPAEGEGAQP